MAYNLPPELPKPRKTVKIEGMPSLEELSIRKKEPVAVKAVLAEKVLETSSGDMVEITLKDGVTKKVVKRKIKRNQIKPKTALTLDVFKIALGLNISESLFYRYVRFSKNRIEKRKRRDFKSVKEACILARSTAGRLTFSFAICNEDSLDKFSKDQARKICQDRWNKGQTVTIANVQKESSILENIRLASDNYLYNVNKDLASPVVESIRIPVYRTLKLLGSLIKRKQGIVEEIWQDNQQSKNETLSCSVDSTTNSTDPVLDTHSKLTMRGSR
jgi:hypothetical protein